MIKKRTWWLLGFSLSAACLQYLLLFGSSSAGNLIYALMALSLDFFNQSAAPTLRPSTEGWPIPTPAGYVLYALLSAAIIFLLLSIVGFLFGWLGSFARRPNQSSKRTREKPRAA
ncbi:hypothetical protein [Rhodanobacter soli]|uniref:hypothetical protein n=1 Tax=Rhodanobacter soli TaxID=590609 RepID=UPI0031CFF330